MNADARAIAGFINGGVSRALVLAACRCLIDVVAASSAESAVGTMASTPGDEWLYGLGDERSC